MPQTSTCLQGWAGIAAPLPAPAVALRKQTQTLRITQAGRKIIRPHQEEQNPRKAEPTGRCINKPELPNEVQVNLPHYHCLTTAMREKHCNSLLQSICQSKHLQHLTQLNLNPQLKSASSRSQQSKMYPRTRNKYCTSIPPSF